VEKQTSKRSLRSAFLIVSLFFLTLPAAAAQSSAALIPFPKPPDVPVEWKQLVGIYRGESGDVIIYEKDGRLFWRAPGREAWMNRDQDGTFWISSTEGPRVDLLVRRNSYGDIVQVSFDERDFTQPASATHGKLRRRDFPRADAGSDPAHFYHIIPAQPVAELRERALKLSPPEEAGQFRKADLVELTALAAALHLDIRYAQSNNFLSTPVYSQARAFMQRPAAEALVRALHKLQPLGYGLLIHDAYRPWYVTRIFWDATPVEGHGFVADPKKGSKHNRGCAVDITLYDLATGQAIEMPGLYDEMSPRSFPSFPGGTSLERWHRDLLRRAIESEGFTVDGNEWWHFDYKDWKEYPILNVPFEKLGELAAGVRAK
jgi:D-alanyl-D-alanine dipeptidase